MAKGSLSTVIKSDNAFGLPLVSVVNSRKLGQVKDVVVDSVRREVVGFIFEDVEWQKGLKILPISAVVRYGEDVVTVRTAEGIPVSKASKMKEFAGVVTVTGASVYDVGGQAIGKLLSFSFNLDSGEVVSCELEAFGRKGCRVIPSKDVVTFGAGTILVKEGMFLVPPTRATKKAVPRKVKAEPVISRAKEKVVEKAVKKKVEARPPIKKVSKEKVKVKPKEKVEAKPLVKKVPQEKVKAKPERKIEELRPKEEVRPREEVPRPELRTKVKPTEKLAKKLAKEVTMGDFLIGQRVTNRVTDEEGSVVAEAGEVVTEEVVKKARKAGVFLQLSFSVEREIF